MAAHPNVILVRAEVVYCAGTSEVPHSPMRLALTEMTIVECPVCSKLYRHLPEWTAIADASWPQKE